MSRVIKYLNVHLPYGPFLSHGSKVLSVNRPRPFLRHVPYSLWTYRKKLMDRHSIGKKGSIRSDMFALESRPTECKIASCNRPSMIAIGGLLHFVCSSAFGSHARRRRTFFVTARSGGARFAVSRYSRTFPVRRVSALSWKGTRKSSRARARGRSTRPRRNEGPLTMRTFFYVRLQYFFNLSARDVM